MTYTNFELVKDDLLDNGQRGLRARKSILAGEVIGVFWRANRGC
ncbi:MAG: hypothetical protein QM523_03570 [Candidatus Pacebacteria bacterium]|nr:hypothetical protein [Candidatus Paceibacterota bacterium]